jgi:SP family facilitated glucose transporter-like MFS transporter 8
LQPYCLVAAGFFFGHFAGMTTLQTYAVSIFAKLGTPIDKYVATLYLGLVELAGALFCVILVHWTGKRPLTFVSTIGNGVCFIVVATYAYFYSSEKTYEWLPVTFLIGSAFMSHIGIRLLPWILIGEVYPSEVRGVASGASGSIGYIFGFLANKTYFYMLNSMTLPGTFWFYGVVSLIGCVVFYFFLPETEGRTLLEIQEHFEGSRNLLKEGKMSPRERENWAVVNPALVPDVETHL